MQIKIDSNPVKVVYQRPSQQEDEFKLSDINPFKKSQWKGNLTEANKGFSSSWKSFGKNIGSFADMVKQDFNEDKKKYGFAGALLRSTWTPTGMLFNPKRTLKYTGALSRAGMDALGGTIGYAGQLIMPKKWEGAIARNAAWLDPTQLATLAISAGDTLVHGLDVSRLKLPGTEDNKGLLDDQYWSWLGDKNMRQDISDTANFAAALYGVKGLKSGIKGMAKGNNMVGLKNVQMIRKGLGSSKDALVDLFHGNFLSMAKNGVSGGANLYFGADPGVAFYTNPFTRHIKYADNAYFNTNKDQFKKYIL